MAAYIDGELAIDIAAGVDADTLIHGYSVGKGTAAVLAAFLVERGELGYDTPVAEYWPEFAKHGKEKITVGHVLSHTSGLPFLPPDITVDTLVDQHAMAELLADRTPEWEPGTATGYQGWTYGHLTAEIVRRATGRTIDEVLRDELTKPLGIEDSLLFSVPDDVKVAPLQASTWETGCRRTPGCSRWPRGWCSRSPPWPTAATTSAPASPQERRRPRAGWPECTPGS